MKRTPKHTRDFTSELIEEDVVYKAEWKLWRDNLISVLAAEYRKLLKGKFKL